MSKYWGYHMLLDCADGALDKIQDEEHIKDFVKELVIAIDMISYGDILISRFATHDEDKAGISFCQLIETSNITGHFVDINGDFYIDVFSCKVYDPEIVIDLVKKYFSPMSIEGKYVLRDAKKRYNDEDSSRL